jgi:hypothetical protein
MSMSIDWQMFRFPFEGQGWQSRLAVGMALGMLAFFAGPCGFIVWLPMAGYGIQIMRRTMTGAKPELPAWNDWGKFFGDGTRSAVVAIVYGLPLIFLCCCCVIGVAGYSYSFANVMRDRFPRPADMAPVLLFEMMFIVTMGVGYAIALPSTLLMMAADAEMVATNSLGRAFNFGRVWRIVRAGAGNYMLALVGFIGAAAALYVVMIGITYTLVLACLGPFLMGLWLHYSMMVYSALAGRAYYFSTQAQTAAPAAGPARLDFDQTPPPEKTDPKLRKPRATPKDR